MKEKKINAFLSIIFPLACLVFILIYWPSRKICFRVEHWDTAHFYANYSFHFFNLKDWIKIAFWAPFNNFRLVPLTSLWNFSMFCLFKTNNFLYWCLSISLCLLNAYLIAKFVSLLRGYKKYTAGVIAGILFLFLPAKAELVMWTFFTYKQVHITLILLGLIAFEKFLRKEKKQPFLPFLLIFLSALFYEASLPILIVLAIRVLFFKSPQMLMKKITTIVFMFSSIGLYLLFYIMIKPYIVKHYAMSTLNVPLSSNVFLQLNTLKVIAWHSILSSWFWIKDGMLIANSGLPIKFISYGYWYILNFPANILWYFLIMPFWLLVVSLLVWIRAGDKKIIYYLLLLLGAGSILIVVGRTFTDSIKYLSFLSIYQYFPSVFIASIGGYCFHEAFRSNLTSFKKKTLLFFLLSILVLTANSTVVAVKSYMTVNTPLITFMNDLGKAISENPDIQIYSGDILLPCTPSPGSGLRKIHSYHALHLLYPNNVIAARTEKKK